VPERSRESFFTPLTGPGWRRPLVFLGRVIRLQPREAVLTTVIVATVGLVEGAAISLLLPLLSLIGVGGAAPGPVERAVASVLHALGIPVRLTAVLGVVLAIGLLQVGLTAAQRYLVIRTAEHLCATVRRRLFDAAGRASWRLLARGHGAHLVSAAVTEAFRIGSVYGWTMTVAGLVVGFVIYVGLAFWLSWQFTLLVLLVGTLSVFALRRIYRTSRRYSAATTAATNRMQEVLSEHVAAVKLIRVLGARPWSQRVFAETVEAVETNARKNQANTVLVKALVEPLGLVALVAMVYVSIDIVRLPAAELMVLLAIFYRITPRVTVFQELLQRIHGVLPGYEAMVETLQRLHDGREREGGVPFPGLGQRLALRGVVVRYGNRPVLDGVDLTIEAGTTVLLGGPSGAGKTTLLDVLAGVVAPDAGAVIVDGVPLASLDLESYRARIAVVPQESVFFHDTIAANLRLPAPAATDAELWEALTAAHADGFVRAAGGLETSMGDQGLRLSGGQRQRLSLARALLKRPDLLLLDEPSSALDAESEAAIRTTLARLHRRMTIVVVSHRGTLSREADAIFRVERGRIVAPAVATVGDAVR
jgi:ATP-binding cassette subfamily C protein